MFLPIFRDKTFFMKSSVSDTLRVYVMGQRPVCVFFVFPLELSLYVYRMYHLVLEFVPPNLSQRYLSFLSHILYLSFLLEVFRGDFWGGSVFYWQKSGDGRSSFFSFYFLLDMFETGRVDSPWYRFTDTDSIGEIPTIVKTKTFRHTGVRSMKLRDPEPKE